MTGLIEAGANDGARARDANDGVRHGPTGLLRGGAGASARDANGGANYDGGRGRGRAIIIVRLCVRVRLIFTLRQEIAKSDVWDFESDGSGEGAELRS